MRKIKQMAVLPYTPEQMYNLVNDIESYPKFLPWCENAKILSENADEIKATIFMAKGILKHKFTTKNTLKKNELIDMELVEGPFQHLEGFWHFKPMGENKCKITFELEFAFVAGIFSAMLDPIFHSMVVKIIDSFKKRAEDVYG